MSMQVAGEVVHGLEQQIVTCEGYLPVLITPNDGGVRAECTHVLNMHTHKVSHKSSCVCVCVHVRVCAHARI